MRVHFHVGIVGWLVLAVLWWGVALMAFTFYGIAIAAVLIAAAVAATSRAAWGKIQEQRDYRRGEEIERMVQRHRSDHHAPPTNDGGYRWRSW